MWSSIRRLADSITDTGAGSRPDLVGPQSSLTVDVCSTDAPASYTPLGLPLPKADPAHPAARQVLQSASRHLQHPTFPAPTGIRKVRYWTQMRYSLPTPLSYPLPDFNFSFRYVPLIPPVSEK
jgi:hypothetical protein